MRRVSLILAFLLIAPLVMTGCATKKYVDTQNQAVASRVDDVEAQVEENQTRLDQQEQEIDQVESTAEEAQGEAQQASKTAQEALERAKEAGKLAEGKLVYEKVLTDNDVKFSLESSELSDEAKAALDDFAQDIKTNHPGAYIEIQGHTDTTGSESYNQKLGLERAEAVQRYLNMKHDIALHRMTVISYGESAPMVDNDTRANRQKNRRVALVVLK